MDFIRNMIIYSSWPDLTANKYESEIQIFTKYFDLIDKNLVSQQMANICEEEQVKSTNVAKIYRTKGNKYYKDLDYAEALKMYNNSISRAPRNSSEFGLAVANRSAVLFDMEKYKECLEDINTVLRSEYPNALRYKVFIRQSKCFLKLNMNSAAFKSVKKAEKYVDKLHLGILQMSSIKDMIEGIKIKLKAQGEIQASNNEPDDDLVLSEPSLRGGENPKYLDAANVVDFKYTRNLGRHVVTNAEIKKGDVLFIEEPYTFAPLNKPETRFDICSFCLHSTVNCIPCTICTSYLYCSDNCRQNAWNLGHRWECLGARRNILSNVAYQLTLSILFKASRDGFKTAIEDASVYGNKDNNHSFVNKLVTHKNKSTNDLLEILVQTAVWMVMYLKNFTDYFDWLYVQPNRPEGSLDDLYNFVGGQLVKYSLQMKCNGVVIRDSSVIFFPIKLAELKETAIGFGIYVSIALLNHSCVPNAVRSFDGTTVIVRALKDIEKGREVSINYLGKSYYHCDRESRQLELKIKYMFKCSCRECTDPNINDEHTPLVCKRCGGTAFPMGNRIIMAKCNVCHFTFHLLEYIINIKRIEELFNTYKLFGDDSLLNVIYKLMKKTYHKNNVHYFEYYAACMKHYKETGQLKKYLEMAKSITELSKNACGDSSMEYLCAVLSYSYLLAKYSITLKIQNSQNYKQFADQSNALIKKSVNVLQFHISNKNIKKVVATITKYLNSDNINMEINNYILEDLDEEDIVF